MSIQDRIAKADADFAAGDYDNALIQVLIAVAATSKKRYPNYGDRKAFESFLASDFGPSLGIGGGYIAISYRGNDESVEHIIYKYLRCKHFHEAEGAPDIVLVPPTTSLVIKPSSEQLEVSYYLIDRLMYVVENASENIGLFP